MGIAWEAREVVALECAGSEAGIRAELARHARPAEPPPWVRRIVERIRGHLDGRADDLADVPLALSRVSDFDRRVYAAARTVGPGRTVSYGALAALAGHAGAARAVGTAMSRCPFPVVVPCHRVIGAGGALGGQKKAGNWNEVKARMLALEGVVLRQPGTRPVPYDAGRAVAELCEADPKLAKLVARAGAFRLALRRSRSPWEELSRSIVYQQITGVAARSILDRVKALSPPFPAPEFVLRQKAARLRACGLSAQKIAALRDLARKVDEGVVPQWPQLRALDDEAIVERLTQVRGVGRWTVEMLLIFGLGRPDVLPAGDYGVRKGYALAWGKREPPAPKALLRAGEKWRPWRSVASWYLWRANELP